MSIIDIMVIDTNKRLHEKTIQISITQAAKDHIMDIGYDEKFGARPLRRVFQRELEDHMAVQTLKGAYKEPTKIEIDFKEGKLEFLETPWTDYKPVDPKTGGNDNSSGNPERSEEIALV